MIAFEITPNKKSREHSFPGFFIDFAKLILVGVVILLACSFTGNVNNNAILGTSVVLVVLGLISYIVINKKIAD